LVHHILNLEFATVESEKHHPHNSGSNRHGDTLCLQPSPHGTIAPISRLWLAIILSLDDTTPKSNTKPTHPQEDGSRITLVVDIAHIPDLSCAHASKGGRCLRPITHSPRREHS
jgi:hypothetical protein